ncbi:histone-lysine N-methyltransferase SETD2, partial [Mytilus galloprovincialis]
SFNFHKILTNFVRRITLVIYVRYHLKGPLEYVRFCMMKLVCLFIIKHPNYFSIKQYLYFHATINTTDLLGWHGDILRRSPKNEKRFHVYFKYLNGSRCQCGEFCTNKRFQKRQFADVDAFRTDWKGFGLKTNAELPHGDFVMEYVGEVLDYKTFKSRTKQYAKSGESHFYFMALNADEVIDASYKGNVSRFINHSCDPNCETQKWTVNGVLRVGFFTKKEIPADTELTFDYQFETYGKEAQKCFCGTEKCRGTIGINKSTPLKSKKKPAEQEEDKEDLFQEEDIEEELDTLSEQGLHNKTDVLNLCRLMVRSEETQFRIKILKIIQECSDRNCLRLFLDYHGLELLWTWMADKTEECQELKVQILTILKDLPINTKNMLKDSKILSLVQRWAGREDGGGVTAVSSSTSATCTNRNAYLYSGINEYTTNELYTDFEGKTGAGNDQVSEAEAVEGHQSSDIDSTSDDSKSREQPVQSPADSSTSTGDVESVAADSSSALEEIKYIEPRPDPMDEVAILADDLLVNWSDLKELFRIPKKQQVEERKRHEKELDKSDVTVKNEKRIEQMEKDQDRFRHLAAGWDTRKKKKRPPPPPPPEEDEFSDRPRKVLLPTPPKISKEERRQIFEAQVKAQEEMAEIERQQREAYLQQFYSDPNNYMYYGQDPNCPLPQGFQVQPGVEGGMEQYIDPNTGQAIPYEVIQAYIAQQQALQQPQAGYTDEALQQQLMSQQVQEQIRFNSYNSSLRCRVSWRVWERLRKRISLLHPHRQSQRPQNYHPTGKVPRMLRGKHIITIQQQDKHSGVPQIWMINDDYMSIIQDDMDIDTPPDDGKSGRKKTTTAAADTSTETAKKIKDQFRQKMSSYIVICLNPFRKPDCKSGRITSTDDFKHLARKLTHHVMSKELKHCRHVEDLEVNENVKSKAKDYVKKYMGKFGMIYRKSASPDD